jgi:hypothetical protein
METIARHIELIRGFNKASIKNVLRIYETLAIIKGHGLWQKSEYYVGQPDFSFEVYRKMDFASFLLSVFGITERWVKSIEDILLVKNGKELLLRYGRSNLVTYCHSTDDERRAILIEAERYKGMPRFTEIKRKLYPGKEVTPINPWKVKYEKLKKEYGALKKEFADYKEKVQGFMDSIQKAA